MGLPIKSLVRNTVFNHFCGGEFIEDCVPVIQKLNRFGVKTILDYSVEGKQKEDDFRKTVSEIVATIEKARTQRSIAFSVFKVSGIARLDLLESISAKRPLTDIQKAEYELVKNRVDIICKAAYQADVPVFIDAEETWIQPAIDALAEQMMETYNKQKHVVYNTVQLYRTDRLSYLMQLTEKARKAGFYPAFKVVRGAYMEKERLRARRLHYPSPIHASKEACDADFNQAVTFSLENYPFVALCAGTHNEESCSLLAEAMQAKGIAPNTPTIWFSQLLGMSDNISFNLAESGYNVAKYVPFGPVEEVMPYLIRRAEENSAIDGQTGRELTLIKKELQRRNAA